MNKLVKKMDKKEKIKRIDHKVKTIKFHNGYEAIQESQLQLFIPPTMIYWSLNPKKDSQVMAPNFLL